MKILNNRRSKNHLVKLGGLDAVSVDAEDTESKKSATSSQRKVYRAAEPVLGSLGSICKLSFCITLHYCSIPEQSGPGSENILISNRVFSK